MLAGMATWPTALTPQPAAPTLSPNAITTIAHGLVHVEPNWISPRLIREMRLDAQDLFAKGLFAPDGLTNTALKKKQQGFNVGDRQTFRNDAWDAAVGVMPRPVPSSAPRVLHLRAPPPPPSAS